MKKLCMIIVMASLALVMTHTSNRFFAQNTARAGNVLPAVLTSSSSAGTNQGTLTVCFKPDFSNVEPCNTKGAVTAVSTIAATVQVTGDSNGNSCSTSVQDQSFAGAPFPPSIQVFHGVAKLIAFDSTTQSGDVAGTNYIGGSCKGATFNAKGAIAVGTFTAHIVISQGGRVDSIVTGLTSSPKGIFGSFSLTGVSFPQ
jgi:hypothetical protein